MKKIVFLFFSLLNIIFAMDQTDYQNIREIAFQGCYYRDSNITYGLENIALATPSFVSTYLAGGTCEDSIVNRTGYYDSELDLVTYYTDCHIGTNDGAEYDKYNIQFSCDASCPIPKNANGSFYMELPTELIDQSSCSATYLSENYNGGTYDVVDAIWLDCAATPTCYADIRSPDSNTTDSNDTTPPDGGTGGGSDTDSQTSPDYTNVLNSIQSDISEIKNIMTTDRKDSEVTTVFDDSKVKLDDGITRVRDSLNSIVDDFMPTVPVFKVTGGQHIFSANVYGQTVSIDLSIFETVRPYFDVFWILLLGYINIKIYWLLIRDLLKKI
jgi:hypothetical protein